MSKSEELIKKAVERYPIGTKIVCLSGDDTVLENEANRFIYKDKLDQVWLIAPQDLTVLVYDKTHNVLS